MPSRRSKSRSRKKSRIKSRIRSKTRKRRISIGGASNKLIEPNIHANTKKENTIMIGKDGFYWQVVNGIWAKPMSQEALGALYDEYQKNNKKQKQNNNHHDSHNKKQKIRDNKNDSHNKKQKIASKNVKPIIIEKTIANSTTNNQIDYLISKTENMVEKQNTNESYTKPNNRHVFTKADFGIKPFEKQKIEFDILNFRHT